MTAELLTPKQKLWVIAETIWPRVIQRRPMHIQVIAPTVEEVLAIELSETMIGLNEWRKPELTAARFIVDAETDVEVSFELRAGEVRHASHGDDPFLAYFADQFSKIDIERSVA